MPFSDGRRDCIGQALAKMNYTAAIATLLSHFHFELAPEVCRCSAPCCFMPVMMPRLLQHI